MHQELTNLEVTRTKFVAEPFVALDLEWRGHQPLPHAPGLRVRRRQRVG